MSYGYALNTDFKISMSETGPYKNLERLLASGEELPVFHNGKKIGRGISCSVIDGFAFWPSDYAVPTSRKLATLKLKFLLDKPLGEDIVNMYPTMVTIRRPTDRSVIFRLLTNFVIETASSN